MNQQAATHPKTKSRNRALVLRLLCTGVANTRVELARAAGLSKMTVGNIVAALIEEGVLTEASPAAADHLPQGRQPQAITLAEGAPLAAGLYIGRDNATVTLTGLDAAIRHSESLPLGPGLTPEGLLDELLALYRRATERFPQQVLGLGIASIGPIDKAAGHILNPPDFHGLANIPVRDYFARHTGLPVVFDNNMNASVIAEQLFGRGKGMEDLIYIGVTHGVGAGVISSGRLMEGATGINGEIGHTTVQMDGPVCGCGNRGCLELYTSIPRLLQQAAGRSGAATPPSWEALVAAARANEAWALDTLADFCDHMAVGIANLVNLFDSGHIFLGHELALAEGLVEQPLENRVNQRILSRSLRQVHVAMSAFGARSPLVGSACLVLHRLFYPV